MPITHWVYKFPPMICNSVIILLMLWTKRDCYIVCLLLSSKTENISLKIRTGFFQWNSITFCKVIINGTTLLTINLRDKIDK